MDKHEETINTWAIKFGFGEEKMKQRDKRARQRKEAGEKLDAEEREVEKAIEKEKERCRALEDEMGELEGVAQQPLRINSN